MVKNKDLLRSADIHELIRQLPEDAKRKLSEMILKDNPEYADAIFVPNKGAQEEAYNSKAREIFYGGSVGGGKTALAIGMSLTKAYSTLFLKINSAQFDQIIPVYQHFLEKYIETGKAFVNKKGVVFGDRRVTFRSLHAKDGIKVAHGGSYDLIVFDEASYHKASNMEECHFWVRSTLKNKEGKTQILYLFNPTQDKESLGMRWIMRKIQYWIHPAHKYYRRYGKVAYFAGDKGKEMLFVNDKPCRPKEFGGKTTYYPVGRTFFLSKTEDNMFVARDRGFMSGMQNAPDSLRNVYYDADFGLDIFSSANQLITTRDIDIAKKRYKTLSSMNFPMTCIGVDVARYGDDDTAICIRRGEFIEPIITLHKKGSVEVGHAIFEIMRHKNKGTYCVVDIGGIGTSVWDFLANSSLANFELVPYTAQTSSFYREFKKNDLVYRFKNKRTEAWWRLAEAFRNGEIAIPDDEELIADLITPTFTIENNIVILEKSEDIKNKLGRSPDKGTSLALCYLYHEPQDPFDFNKINYPEGRRFNFSYKTY